MKAQHRPLSPVEQSAAEAATELQKLSKAAMRDGFSLVNIAQRLMCEGMHSKILGSLRNYITMGQCKADEVKQILANLESEQAPEYHQRRAGAEKAKEAEKMREAEYQRLDEGTDGPGWQPGGRSLEMLVEDLQEDIVMLTKAVAYVAAVPDNKELVKALREYWEVQSAGPVLSAFCFRTPPPDRRKTASLASADTPTQGGNVIDFPAT